MGDPGPGAVPETPQCGDRPAARDRDVPLAVPTDTWQRLLDGATRQVGILVYAALFVPEQNPRWISTLREKAEAGVKVEILLGDPDGTRVAERGSDEGIGAAMGGKVHNVLAYYNDLRDVENVAIYFHDTTLYNSIYRFDDDMLVNTHAYGAGAAQSPVMHVRRIAGGHLFPHYLLSFERVWETARVKSANASELAIAAG